MSTHHRLIVFTEPVIGREDEYNEWYDEVHLPEVLATDGFVAALCHLREQAGGGNNLLRFAELPWKGAALMKDGAQT